MSEQAVLPRVGAAPEAPAATWVELRVHGVSGTPPGSMLDVDADHVHPVSAAGRRGVFYRRCDDDGNDVGVDADGRILEAYHWGDYTERDPGQGLWVLLVPFGIVNAAQFMLPAASRNAVAHAVAGAMLRVIALVVTCLAVLGVSFVAMDRLAWRAVDPGPARLGWLLLAACAPVAVLIWLRRVGSVKNPGTRSLAENPGVTEDPAPPDRRRATGSGPAPAAAASPLGGLASSYFYIGSPATPSRTDAPTLRWLHLAVGTALVAVLLAWPAAAASYGPARVATWCALGLLLVLVVTMILLGDPEELASPPSTRVGLRAVRLRWHLLVFRAAPVAFGLAVAALAGAAVADGLATQRVTAAQLRSGSLPGITGLTFVLVVIGGTAAVVLIAACWFLGRAGAAVAEERVYQRYAHGTAGALAATIGMFLGILYTGGFVTIADVVVNAVWPLGTGSRWTPANLVALPNIVRHIEIAWMVTIVVTLGFVVVLVLRYLSLRSRLQAAAVRDFARPAGPGGVTLDDPLQRTVAKAMYVARLKNLIPQIFALYAVTGLVTTIAVGIDLQGAVPWLGQVRDTSWYVLVGTGLLVLLGAAVAVVAFRARTSLGLRRGANTVWDVVSFWPRSVHPFVPVAYSQVVVAELRRRISHHVRDGHAVVLAGHSQGSLVSVAALLWVPEGEREHVGLLTFGSQLRQMFSRAFPAYVDTGVFTWLWREYGGRWRNLYRDTDHLAGPALSWHHRTVDGDGGSSANWPGTPEADDTYFAATRTRQCGPDWRLLDPRLPVDGATHLDHGPGVTLFKHSAYWTDPDWDRAVTAVRPVVAPPGPAR